MQLTVDFAPSVLAKVVPQPITHTSPRIQSEYTGERGNLIPISGHRSSPNPITMENRTDNRYKSCLFNMLKNISSFSTYFTFKMCFWQQTGYFHIRYRITICLFALLLMGLFYGSPQTICSNAVSVLPAHLPISTVPADPHIHPHHQLCIIHTPLSRYHGATSN